MTQWNASRVAAVDPGIGGALLLVEDGAVLDCTPMPVLKVTKAGKTKTGKKPVRSLIDGQAVRQWLLDWAPGHFVIEQQGPRAEQGLGSTATTMRQFGLLEGIAVGLGLPYSLMMPQVWRAAIKAPVGKEGSLVACGRLAPQVKARIEQALKDKVHRIAACDAWGMTHAWAGAGKNVPVRKSERADKRTGIAEPDRLSNDEFFA